MKSCIPRRSELRTIVDNSVNNLFNDFSKIMSPWNFGDAEWFSIKGGYPKVNVKDLADRIEIDAAIPGLTKGNVNVEWSNDLLFIKGESQNETESNENSYIMRELHRRSFARSFNIAEEKFDIEKIEADVDNGILRVIIPKREHLRSEPEVKKIDIK